MWKINKKMKKKDKIVIVIFLKLNGIELFQMKLTLLGIEKASYPREFFN